MASSAALGTDFCSGFCPFPAVTSGSDVVGSSQQLRCTPAPGAQHSTCADGKREGDAAGGMMKPNCAWADHVQVYLWLQDQDFGADKSDVQLRMKCHHLICEFPLRLSISVGVFR